LLALTLVSHAILLAPVPDTVVGMLRVSNRFDDEAEHA